VTKAARVKAQRMFDNSQVWWLFWVAFICTGANIGYESSPVNWLLFVVVVANGIIMLFKRHKAREMLKNGRDFSVNVQ
jgi:predicted branched-subunit amino acid permease